jgi:hypothetical protein
VHQSFREDNNNAVFCNAWAHARRSITRPPILVLVVKRRGFKKEGKKVNAMCDMDVILAVTS